MLTAHTHPAPRTTHHSPSTRLRLALRPSTARAPPSPRRCSSSASSTRASTPSHRGSWRSLTRSQSRGGDNIAHCDHRDGTIDLNIYMDAPMTLLLNVQGRAAEEETRLEGFFHGARNALRWPSLSSSLIPPHRPHAPATRVTACYLSAVEGKIHWTDGGSQSGLAWPACARAGWMPS